MTIKLDAKDYKLLYELDINARQPATAIAKKIGVSKQVAGFRIKRLVEEDLVSSFHTVIDVAKLGFTIHKSFLRLQNLDKERQLTLISFLKNHPEVVWVASCDGRYDLAFGTRAKNMEHLDYMLKELNKKFGDCIAERQIASIIRGEYFIRDYLISKKEPSGFRKSFFGSVSEQIDIDEHDWKILVELGKNARTSTVDIAGVAGMSADAVADRIKNLEHTGIIRHYNIVPNESKYHYLHYKILVGLRNMTEDREKTLIEFCRLNSHIVYIVKALGPWEFEIDMEVENAEQFRKIMMDIKTRFKDIIKDYSALQLYQVHKYNFCPSVPKQ